MQLLCINVNFVLLPYFYKILLCALSRQLVFCLCVRGTYVCKKETTHRHEVLSNFHFSIPNLISRKKPISKTSFAYYIYIGCVFIWWLRGLLFISVKLLRKSLTSCWFNVINGISIQLHHFTWIRFHFFVATDCKRILWDLD